MLSTLITALVLWTSLSITARAAPHSRKRPVPGASGASGASGANAIYFLTNDQTNAVVALPIAADGTLSNGTVTPTGGAGSNSIDGTTNQAAKPDALIGQSALTVAGQFLFAVNAGSNTLTMMSISSTNPTKLTMLGSPVALPGEFPNTVAASAKNQLACVGTTGAKNGVSCSTFSKAGLGAMDDLRSFGLNQTTPPVGPTNSVSQLFFSSDESTLFATVKGNPAVNNTGFFSSFPVQASSSAPGTCGASSSATVATQDIRSSPPGTAVLFGSAVIPGTSNVFATDASFGAAVLSVDPTTNAAAVVGKQAIDGQKATCWATVSAKTGSGFVTDVGVNHVVEMSLTDAHIISTTDLSTADGDPGLIDLKASGNAIYALSPGNGTTGAAVSVLDVSGGQGSAKLIQHFELSGMGVDANAQGMAVLME